MGHYHILSGLLNIDQFLFIKPVFLLKLELLLFSFEKADVVLGEISHDQPFQDKCRGILCVVVAAVFNDIAKVELLLMLILLFSLWQDCWGLGCDLCNQ